MTRWFGIVGLAGVLGLGCGATKPAQDASDTSSKTADKRAHHTGKADEEPVIAAIPSPCGLFVLVNWRNRGAVAMLKAKKVGMPDSNANMVWIIDDALVQIQFTPAAVMKTELKGAALLDHHRNWEVAWVSEQKQWPSLEPKVFTSELVGRKQDIPGQVWAFTAPAPYEVLGVEVQKAAYATMAIGDGVLVLGSPIAGEPQPTLNLFLSAFRTLTVDPEPTDLESFAEVIRSQAEADPTCERGHGKSAPN